MSLVEFIPATSEAILCGRALPDNSVLIHTKDKPSAKQVDIMVRSKLMSVTDKVVEVLMKANV